MAACPYWLGFLLLNPLRRLMEDPRTILAPYVREGMTVLEPGCAMGFFTLELARLVGPNGRVVAVDLQEKMLENLRRRAQKAGLAERIETRLAPDGRLAVADLAGKVDLAVAIHMVHEVTDQAAFFAMVFAALKPGRRPPGQGAAPPRGPAGISPAAWPGPRRRGFGAGHPIRPAGSRPIWSSPRLIALRGRAGRGRERGRLAGQQPGDRQLQPPPHGASRLGPQGQ